MPREATNCFAPRSKIRLTICPGSRWPYFMPTGAAGFQLPTALTARLFRDGFHALAILPSGALVAAVPKAIVTLRPGDTEFRQTHAILRGTRPLHITAVPGGTIFWGEYFDNPAREEVHIYASTDAGATWSVAYTFPKGAIRHVHNIVHDPWEDCLWVLTGDYGDECRILRAACDFSRVEAVLQGKQQARAVAAVPTEDGLYFSSDTPLESNYIYRLDRQESLLADLLRSAVLRFMDAASAAAYFFLRWWNRARSIAIATFASMAAAPTDVKTGTHCCHGKKIAGPWDCSNTATPSCRMATTQRHSWL